MSKPQGNPVTARWLDGQPNSNFGTTFGLPWRRGEYQPSETIFTCSSKDGSKLPIQTWVAAYWPDGSIKWTGHAIPGSQGLENAYSIEATRSVSNDPSPQSSLPQTLKVTQSPDGDLVEVKTGKINVLFSKLGHSVIQKITTGNDKVVGQNGRLVLLSQSSISDEGVSDPSARFDEFQGKIDEITIEQEGPIRAVIAIRGKHVIKGEDVSNDHLPWLPFTLRFYFYAESESIRIVHTIVFDGDYNKDFIRGIGIRFNVPLDGEKLINRHVRFSGVEDGIFGEAIQGITGLRKDPGKDNRQNQVQGKSVGPSQSWDPGFTNRLKWVPAWNDYSLSQLSPDGFNLQKRTKAGHSWVKIPGGTRAGGLVYLGGANRGGLALGLRDFWERYPTGLDVRDAATEQGQITAWLYSPSAEPMDLRPYHDGLNQETYDEQLDALWITYEDWEKDLGTPYGVARTNELFLFAFDHTPESDKLSSLTQYIRNPPVLVTDPATIYHTEAFGTFWSPASFQISPSSMESQLIDKNLDFLFNFYKDQIAQRRWYGFWDYGDIMHTYDEDRHTWRYDIGGYAWDNSELSPDLWLWLFFLRTGRADVYRLAEALTRHTGEVDVYHLGPYKGLGTRHGVQHWSDSCKQARISNALYRRFFYYLTGGDERTGDLLQEVLSAESSFLTLDPYRKVRQDKSTYTPDPRSINISLGTDWTALAAAWFISHERRDQYSTESRDKLLHSIRGIASLRNGFVTGSVSYDSLTGAISQPVNDPSNAGVVRVSHLSAMFGLFELCAEIISSYKSSDSSNTGSSSSPSSNLDLDPSLTIPSTFQSAWLDYCTYYNADPSDQALRYGTSFPNLQLHQGHSRLTAYAAWKRGDQSLAKRAWNEFWTGDGLDQIVAHDEKSTNSTTVAAGNEKEEDKHNPQDQDPHSRVRPWQTTPLLGSQVPVPVDEAPWITTNYASLYGLAATQALALIGDEVEDTLP